MCNRHEQYPDSPIQVGLNDLDNIHVEGLALTVGCGAAIGVLNYPFGLDLCLGVMLGDLLCLFVSLYIYISFLTKFTCMFQVPFII